MKTFRAIASRRPGCSRAALAALTLALFVGTGGCGRRGPPLAPIQVDPEAPRLLPLQQEGGQVVVRWFAPRLDSGGDVAELRLRRAVVSYRVVDLLGLAVEERAAERQEPDEADDVDTASDDEPLADLSEAEGAEPDMAEEAATDPGAPEAAEPPGGGESPSPDPETGVTVEPDAEEIPAEEESPGEPSPETNQEAEAPTDEPVPEETLPEGAPAAGESPDVPEEQPPTTGEPLPEESEPVPDETLGEPDTAEPAGEATGGGDAAQSAESEAEPEPTGMLLEYEDLEFEVLTEMESEVLGEERILELPVEPDWIGRRLEITVRYEARSGASEESEIRSLDVTGPLPVVEGLLVDVSPSALTVRWEDPRPALEGPPPLSDLVFEVFRRRGGESERLGRSSGLQRADAEVVWGEETCYQARLVVAGSAEESVIPDPGPVPPEDVGTDGPVEEATPEDDSAAEVATPAAPGEGGTTADPALESGDSPGDPLEEPTLPPEGSEPEAAPWNPIPIRVPGAGPGAMSLGPLSAEVCITPVDEFPPLPPSDLRLLWRAQQTDLSWRESTSTDVVGYHVYRSGPDGTGFARLTRSSVEQTSFTDADRDPRGEYRYAITAVDGADPPNESLPSDSRRANPR